MFLLILIMSKSNCLMSHSKGSVVVFMSMWSRFVLFTVVLLLLGVPIKVINVVDGKAKDSPLEIFSYLNEIG